MSNGCVVIGTDCSAIGHNVSTTNKIILLCLIGSTVNGLSQPFAGVLYIIDSLSEFNWYNVNSWSHGSGLVLLINTLLSNASSFAFDIGMSSRSGWSVAPS